MPTPPKRERKFTSWSFSRWAEYTECPFRAAAKHIDKSYPGESNEAMERGNVIHKQAEDFAGGRLRTLPKELQTFAAEFKLLKTKKPAAEQTWDFDLNWHGTVPNRYNPLTWLRVKMDAHYYDDANDALHVIDYKTGKIKQEEHRQQLELYGLAGLLMFPTALVVTAQLWYTDQGKESTYETTRKDLPRLKKLWLARVKPMFADRKFPPRPGRYCSWCALGHTKGGPCNFG